jgi:hypothetical protein
MKDCSPQPTLAYTTPMSDHRLVLLDLMAGQGQGRRSAMPAPQSEEPVALRWSEYVDDKGRIDFDGFVLLLRDFAGLHYPKLRLEPLEGIKNVSGVAASIRDIV